MRNVNKRIKNYKLHYLIYFFVVYIQIIKLNSNWKKCRTRSVMQFLNTKVPCKYINYNYFKKIQVNFNFKNNKTYFFYLNSTCLVNKNWEKQNLNGIEQHVWFKLSSNLFDFKSEN